MTTTPTELDQRPDTATLAGLEHVHVAGRCIKNRRGPTCTTTTNEVRRCRACGCTDNNACQSFLTGPCWWVEEDLCSACKPLEPRP